MSTRELQEALMALINNAKEDGALDGEVADAIDDVREVIAYREAGILTTDSGFIVRTTVGGEFQVTIVRSR